MFRANFCNEVPQSTFLCIVHSIYMSLYAALTIWSDTFLNPSNGDQAWGLSRCSPVLRDDIENGTSAEWWTQSGGETIESAPSPGPGALSCYIERTLLHPQVSTQQYTPSASWWSGVPLPTSGSTALQAVSASTETLLWGFYICSLLSGWGVQPSLNNETERFRKEYSMF
jgi:hypothetical protein